MAKIRRQRGQHEMSILQNPNYTQGDGAFRWFTGGRNFLGKQCAHQQSGQSYQDVTHRFLKSQNEAPRGKKKKINPLLDS